MFQTNKYLNILPSLEADCKQRTTPNAVPKYAVAKEPVLQCVNIRTCSPSITLLKIALAPNSPIDLLSDISFSNIASIAATNLQNKWNFVPILRKNIKRISEIYLACISCAETDSSLSKEFI